MLDGKTCFVGVVTLAKTPGEKQKIKIESKKEVEDYEDYFDEEEEYYDQVEDYGDQQMLGEINEELMEQKREEIRAEIRENREEKEKELAEKL